ncbi:unnamed protein product [Bursaphelenchus okinawaensis]|uniref:Uncharacterized protein n=1 Tax=Bursaphelenchus okinawaensis TaxID=465554 RepID=A0A811KB96_9BILA|nr:unnamed protein product [Bursaphelenchus okinawaensis]CAG9100794.1 unnamed protein product [Bursaphelenchus okinawaensis]
MDSGVSSGYHSLDRKASMIPSSSMEFVDPNYYPNCPQTPVTAMENIPPYQQTYQQLPYNQAVQYNGYNTPSKQKSPGRRYPQGYITPQQQIIQQQQQKISMDQSPSLGLVGPFRNWNLGENPMKMGQGPSSVHGSSMSQMSMMSRASRFSTVSVRTDYDEATLTMQEQYINMNMSLTPEQFVKQTEFLVQYGFTNPDVVQNVFTFLKRNQLFNFEPIIPLCGQLYIKTIKTLPGGEGQLPATPGFFANIFGILYYLLKMPLMKNLTEQLLNKDSDTFCKILRNNLAQNQEQNTFCLRIICNILRQLFPGDSRKQSYRFLNKLPINRFADKCRGDIWKVIVTNLLYYSNPGAAIEALRLIFKSESKPDRRNGLITQFVYAGGNPGCGGLYQLLQCLQPGKSEATLYSAAYLILDLLNDNSITKIFIQLEGLVAAGYYLEHESPLLVRKIARILRDTSSDELIERQDRAKMENIIFNAILNLDAGDKVCVEHVTGFLCNVARISWVKVYLWKRSAVHDFLRVLDFELGHKYLKDPEAETTRLETIDNLLVAVNALMNCPINRNNEANNNLIRIEEESFQRQQIAKFLFVDNESRFQVLVGELWSRAESGKSMEWKNEDIEIQRHIIMLQTHFLNYFPDRYVFYACPISPINITVVQIIVSVLHATVCQLFNTHNRDETKMNSFEINKKRERMFRLTNLSERSIQFLAQIIDSHQSLIPSLNECATEIIDMTNRTSNVFNLARETYMQTLKLHFQKHERDEDYDYIEFDKPNLL